MDEVILTDWSTEEAMTFVVTGGTNAPDQLKQVTRTILLSTHILSQVEDACDRVVIIARGRVVASGTPDELRQQAGESQLEEAFMRLIGEDAEALA